MARSEKSLGQLVEAFAQHTAAQTDAIFRGDAKTGNKHARKRIAAFKKLRSHGDAGRAALTVLFKHPRMDVRAMAAAYLLRYRTAQARSVLMVIAKGVGLAALGASEALKRWEEGTWALDPSDSRAEAAERPPVEKTQLKKLSADQLIEETRSLSAQRWRAINAGKPKDGNRMFDLLVAIRRELRTRGMDAQRRLLGLLDDPDPGTRCWAAVSVLEFAPSEGERVLADLARHAEGLVGFSAEWTLEKWKAGTLKPL